MDASKYDSSFSLTANWRIASGVLTDSFSFESSYSSTAAKPESEDETISSVVDHVPKSPLLLLPPVPNCEPCEITITFGQEHELRQVYIRSSAKVYEIYYTKKQRHDKEYLCTVRCGIAMRGEEEEEVLQIPLNDSSSSKDAKVKANGNVHLNEDDWVEVPQLEKQDLFEATAEINDAEPCISITLRLLSLQDKSYAFVDEVYIFADPIDQTDSEQEEATGTGNSSSSSLMAIFMPTLLQLARGKDVRKEQDRKVSDRMNSETPRKIKNEIQQEANFSKADYKGVSSPVLVNTIANHVDEIRVSGSESKPPLSCNNMEAIMHQLVNKVTHIESILTRFEDQMLKPINSIDARLQLVEKKLEQLGNKSLEPEVVVEIKTPNSDSTSSGADSETNDLNGLTKDIVIPQLASSARTVVPESCSTGDSEDCRLEQASENNLISGNLVISAETEISNEEEKPKRSLSINDALASALAGLLSSSSITDTKYSQALVVTAPEFLIEDDLETEKKPQAGINPDKILAAVEESGDTDSALESPTSSQNEPGITLCIEDGSQEMINGVSEKFGDSMVGYGHAETMVSVRNNDLDEETATSSTKADCYTDKNPDSCVHEPENPNANVEEHRGVSRMDDILKSVLGFEPSTSSVNFLTPVLDVKFETGKKDFDNKCFFETLLAAESDKTVVDCNNEEALDDNLVSMEEEEVKGPPTDTLSSLEMDYYETNEMHVQLETEISTASLI